MLAKAAQAPSRVRWQAADIRTWAPPAAPDILYSNAMLHWVDGHETVFPRLFGMLAPGGVLAVQMSLSWPEPSPAALRQVMAETVIGTPALRYSVHRRWGIDAELYYGLLTPISHAAELVESISTQQLHAAQPA